MAVPPDKPLTFAIRRHGEQVGSVLVEEVGDQCVVTNRSSMPCTVNGQERVRTTLFDDDEVLIGKDRFRVVVADEESDAEGTQIVDLVAMRRATPCAICDGPFEPATGWSDGARSICASCLGKGAGPQHIASVASAVEESTHDHVPVPAAPARQLSSPSSDGASDSDRLRHQRRISASRLSAVESKPGLLAKMSAAVFGGKEERQRLEKLEKERAALLIEAGRLSLQGGGGLGLSSAHLTDLISEQTVTITADDLDRPTLDNWKAHRERLAYLDAEISALRRAQNLSPAPGLMPAPPSLREQKSQAERTFATLDGLGTEELARDDLADQSTTPVRVAKLTAVPPRPTGKRPPPRRRR